MELELKHQYAADENEREDTAKHFLNEFKSKSEKKFIFKIGPYGDSSITQTIIAYLKSRFDVIKVEKSEEKAFFARLDFYIEAQLKPMRVNYKNMLRISNALYDLGLAQRYPPHEIFTHYPSSRFSRDGDPISFACPKETGERKGHPTLRPSASLCYSINLAAAELAALRQSSPKPLDCFPLLGAVPRGYKVKTI